MATVRPSALPAAAGVTAGASFVVDNGAAVERATPGQIIDAATPLASQAEAEAGSNNAKRVSPLRVRQAIDALALGRLASNNTGDGAGLVALTTGGTVEDAVKAVSPLQKAAVGDGTANDTGPVETAAAAGRNLSAPKGFTFAVSGVGSLAHKQLISGGAVFKKYGTALEAIFTPADGTDQLHFAGLSVDGNSSAFTYGNPVSGLLGYLLTSPRFTFNHVHDVIDSAVKVRDGMGVVGIGNLIEDVDENGFELYNYATDPRGGGDYTARPLYEGGHIVGFNTIRRVTRYEAAEGPIVDASCIAMAGAAGHGHKLIVDIGNVTEDTQHHHWYENNAADSEMDAAVVVGNVGWTGLSGGTADNVFGKSFLGFIGCKNSLAIGNVGRNAGNHLVEDTITAFVNISGAAADDAASGAVNDGLILAHNIFEDDTGDSERTQRGFSVLSGQRMLIAHNMTQGASEREIHLYGDAVGEDTAGTLVDVACYGNVGAEGEYSWHQPREVLFTRLTLDTTGTQSALINDSEDEYIVPCSCRIVGITGKLTSAIAAGTLTVKVMVDGVEDTEMRLVFGSGEIESGAAVFHRSSLAGDQLTALQRVKITTVTSGIAGGNNASFGLMFDLGMKR